MSSIIGLVILMYISRLKNFYHGKLCFVTAADTPPSHGGYINLGDLKKIHWADRVLKVDRETSMATEAVTISKDELIDFLNIATATFGIFRVKMPDEGTPDFFMYIVRGLEFCKFNHLKDFAVK